MDFELRRAREKLEKEQRERKERAKLKLERDRKAKQEALRQREAIEAAQRQRRIDAAEAESKVHFLSGHSSFLLQFFVLNSISSSDSLVGRICNCV